MRVKWQHIFCVPLYFYVNMFHWSGAVRKYTINFKVNLYVSMFWQSTNFQLWGSMCHRPLLRTFTSGRRRQGNRKWSTVLRELFVSRCVSEFFLKPNVHCRFHKCPSTGPNSETSECPSRFIIIIFTNCIWVITRWQWLFHMYTNMEEEKKVTRKFKSGGLHGRHVVSTWKLGNHLSIRL